MKAFLMIGQSNMAGRGDFEDVSPITNPRLHMLRNGLWQPLSEPVNPDRSILYPFGGEKRYHSGISLAPAFAEAYAETYGEEVGLIPCADGGTCIAQWAEGSILFDHAVLMTKLTMRHSELAGILWHQGESDSDTLEKSEVYFERLCELFHALRRQLGMPELPVVMGELGRYMLCKPMCDAFPYAGKINEAIHQAAKEIGCAAVASSEGLVTRCDGIHFDASSLRCFGKRYFEVFQQLVQQKKG